MPKDSRFSMALFISLYRAEIQRDTVHAGERPRVESQKFMQGRNPRAPSPLSTHGRRLALTKEWRVATRERCCRYERYPLSDASSITRYYPVLRRDFNHSTTRTVVSSRELARRDETSRRSCCSIPPGNSDGAADRDCSSDPAAIAANSRR